MRNNNNPTPTFIKKTAGNVQADIPSTKNNFQYLVKINKNKTKVIE